MANVRALPTAAMTVTPAKVGRYIPRTFGGLEAPQLLGILRNADRGMLLEEWADLVEWISEDDRVASVIETRVDQVCGIDFECVPGRAMRGQEQLAEQAAQVCQAMLESTDRITQVFDDLLHCYALGYSAAEHEWRFENGMWVSQPRVIRPRDIAFSADWGFRFRTFGENSTGDEWIAAKDHPGKFITFPLRKRGSTPLRAGAIRQVAMMWLFKRWAWKAWMYGAERLGQPIAVGKVQRDATEAAREALKSALEGLSEGQSGVIEELTAIEFPNTGFSMSADMFEKLIDRADKAITIAILGSVDAVDGGANGSLARAQTQAEMTIEPRTSKLAYQLYEVVERDWLAPFLAYNSALFGGVTPPTPRIVIKEDESELNTERFAAFGALATSGIVSTNEIRQSLGLEPVQGGDVLIQASPEPVQQTSFDFSAEEAPAALPLAEKPLTRMRTTKQRTSATSKGLTHALVKGLGLSSAGRLSSSRKRR